MSTITHEIINYQSNVPVKLFFQRIGTSARHWHSSIEILFVLQGSMQVAIENHSLTLKEDDILLINPNHIHELSSPDCSLIVVQMRLGEFHLDWAIPENIQFDCNSALDPGNSQRYFHLKHLIAMLLKNNTSDSEFSQLSNYACAIDLIRELCLNFRREGEAYTPHSIKYLNRLKSILEYIHENYKEPITLTDLAKRQFLTPAYLSSFFEKTMGVSLSTYINNVRLDHAIIDLINTDDSIEAIAARCGFARPRSFSSVFKKYYHMLPSEYRKQIKSLPDTGRNIQTRDRSQTMYRVSSEGSAFAPPQELLRPKHQNSYLMLERYDFLSRLAPYLQEHPGAQNSQEYSSKTALGEISAISNSAGRWNSSFKCFCGVSRASELLLPPIRDMIRQAQKDIGFKYIKFHGILDDDLMVCTRDASGQLHFNFFYVDMILDFLLENHLRPMIQYSFMPAALAASANHTVFQKPVIISPPSSNDEWCSLITAFTRHLLERYGAHQVRQWIFTFWNETLSGLSFDFEDAQTALDLYRQTRQKVKDCDPALIFASTSYSALKYPELNYDRFLNYAREHQCLPDVYIFHFYPVVADDNAFNASARQWKAQDYTQAVALSRDPDIFHHFLESLAKAGIEADKIYITEWNFSPSHREWLNDTCFSACYIVRNMVQNHNKAAGFCHWCLTDLHQELPMPHALFHGGLGLFTRNGIPKPAYFAYDFLNRLLPEILYNGEGCCITRDKDHFAILLYNYYHFNNLYGHGITFDTTDEHWQAAFSGAVTKEISFTLTDMRNGAYELSCRYIHPGCGSPFEAWISMGRPDLDTPEELQLLKSRACPGFYKKTLSVTDHCLEISQRLEPHEIRLITLRLASPD